MVKVMPLIYDSMVVQVRLVSLQFGQARPRYLLPTTWGTVAMRPFQASYGCSHSSTQLDQQPHAALSCCFHKSHKSYRSLLSCHLPGLQYSQVIQKILASPTVWPNQSSVTKTMVLSRSSDFTERTKANVNRIPQYFIYYVHCISILHFDSNDIYQGSCSEPAILVY